MEPAESDSAARALAAIVQTESPASTIMIVHRFRRWPGAFKLAAARGHFLRISEIGDSDFVALQAEKIICIIQSNLKQAGCRLLVTATPAKNKKPSE